ncbi:MADS-box protein, partial [Trifolium pratense]
EKILTDEIQELNRKGSLIHQENVELYKKVYGTSDTAATATSKNAFGQFPYGVFEGGDCPQTLFNLQLCLPEQEQYCETSGSGSATK